MHSLKRLHEDDVEEVVDVVPVSFAVVADMVVVQAQQASVVVLVLQAVAPVVLEAGRGVPVVPARSVPTGREELKGTVPMADCSAREQSATDAVTLDSRAYSVPASGHQISLLVVLLYRVACKDWKKDICASCQHTLFGQRKLSHRLNASICQDL